MGIPLVSLVEAGGDRVVGAGLISLLSKPISPNAAMTFKDTPALWAEAVTGNEFLASAKNSLTLKTTGSLALVYLRLMAIARPSSMSLRVAARFPDTSTLCSTPGERGAIAMPLLVAEPELGTMLKV